MTAPPPNPGGYRADWCDRCTDSTPHARDTGRCLWCAVEVEIVPVGDALPEGWRAKRDPVRKFAFIDDGRGEWVGDVYDDGEWYLYCPTRSPFADDVRGAGGLPALLSECCERGWYGLPEELPVRETPTGGAGQQAAELVRERDVYADPVTLDTEDGTVPGWSSATAFALNDGAARSRSDARARVLRVLGERYHDDTLCGGCGGLLDIHRDVICVRCTQDNRIWDQQQLIVELEARDRPSLLRRIVRAVRERVGGDDG